MTGLNLEGFLRLLRADLGAWTILGVAAVVLILLTWTSWGSRRALRKCLVLSIAAHLGLALYGSTFLIVLLALKPRTTDAEPSRARIREIRIAPWRERQQERDRAAVRQQETGRLGTRVMPWDQPRDTLVLADPKLEPPRPELPAAAVMAPVAAPESPPLAAETAAPAVPSPTPPDPDLRPQATPAEPPLPPLEATPGAPEEIAAPVVPLREAAEPDAPPGPDDRGEARIRPERSPAPPPGRVPVAGPPDLITARSRGTETAIEGTALRSRRPESPGAPAAAESAEAGTLPEVSIQPVADPAPAPGLPEADMRLQSRPERAGEADPIRGGRLRATQPPAPIALARVTPGALPRATDVHPPSRGRRIHDVPDVYRSRLDPNRSVLAQHAGASSASEQAVERALDWLARHQDGDGRWDGATARYEDGTAVKGDDDYTSHCPPGETCFGECIYWEADTALTGLALLAYLGSGYTPVEGHYSQTVARGLDFLLAQQKPDGDLRGRSQAVGMYCHAMATLALCEAYALTGDERLRDPVERGIGFLVRARATDGQAWRYKPGAPIGDTSILGWVVMALKSAKVVGIPVSASVRNGTLAWLNQVATGPEHGLGRYQPHDPVTPTMTAEAWVCRQFLNVGGPGPASSEAADYLLAHGPDHDPYNLYYWYYGTLAMYQHGGEAWTRWNAQVRDQIVRRQHASGHMAGSWDPDDSLYGTKGGRIYCTALATLTLEVYYRFLRLYDDPKLPSSDLDATVQGRRDRLPR